MHDLLVPAFVALLSPLALAPPADPPSLRTRIHVAAAASPGGNGATWASAFDDLQPALALAATIPGGADIWVATGIYRPDGPGGSRDATLRLADGVVLRGGFAGHETVLEEREPDGNPVLLSGDLDGDDLPGFGNYGENSHHVVTARGRVALEHVTIRGGHANAGTSFVGAGAGLVCVNAEVRLTSVVLEDNLAAHVPGAQGAGALAVSSRLELRGCLMRRNAFAGGSGSILGGGGLALFRSVASLRRSRFEENRSTQEGGAVLSTDSELEIRGCEFAANYGAHGGAISATGSTGSIRVDDSLFLRNRATGGAAVAVEVPLVLTRSRLLENEATLGGGLFVVRGGARVREVEFRANRAVSGGGVGMGRGHLEIDRCTFVDNRLLPNAGAGRSGSGLTLLRIPAGESSVTVRNSLFVGHEAEAVWSDSPLDVRLESCTLWHDSPGYAALRNSGSGSIVLESSILWGTAPTLVGPGAIGATWSCVRDGLPGAGNFQADPGLLDPGGGSFALAADSPCIDAGNPGLAPRGRDLDGDPRDLDGLGTGTIVRDVGADEFNPVRLEAVRTGTGLRLTLRGPALLDSYALVGLPGSGGRFLPGFGSLLLEPLRILPGPTGTTPVEIVVPIGEPGVAVQVLGRTVAERRVLSNAVVIGPGA